MRNPFSMLLGAALILPLAVGAAEKKPHIILVMADDQGWGDMAYNGHLRVKTPNFDKAAATGLRFDRFYAAAPVCSPTRASVLTGRHPNRMGVFKWGHPLRPQEFTLAEALKTAGYATAHFGKWHLGSVREKSPVNPGATGFDHWISAPNFYDNDPTMSAGGKAVRMQGESSMIAVDAALGWMREKLKDDAPIFAVVWFGSPHVPHEALAEDREAYEDLPEADRHFLGEITGMDRAFGKLRDALTELGIRDNTVLWYTSDNGALPKVGSTGGFRGRKGSIYEGGLLVPAILEWPAMIPAHRATSLRCNTSDIFPTLLEITGVQPPEQRPLDGLSLLTGLIDVTDDSRGLPRGFEDGRSMGFWDSEDPGIGTPSVRLMEDLYQAQQKGLQLPPAKSSLNAAKLPDPPRPTDRFPGHSAWIDGDWKLHRIQQKDRLKWELYHLAEDPYEEEDVSKSAGGQMESMKDELEKWLGSVARSLNGADYRQP